jgi:uncharacterized membrane protein YidH (DUF202 family)
MALEALLWEPAALRAQLAVYRIQLAAHRTQLAAHRTQLAAYRTQLAAHRMDPAVPHPAARMVTPDALTRPTEATRETAAFRKS